MALTNEIRLIGNCAEAPVKIQTKSGKYIVKIGVYTRHWWRDESGELKEQEEPHYCLFFGSNAEKALRFLQKGTQIHLRGIVHYEPVKKPSPFKDRYTRILVEEFTVSDRIMVSKEMYQALFPDQETNRAELPRQRYEMEEFDKEVAHMENRAKELKGKSFRSQGKES